MANPVLWFEVTGKDGMALRKFYTELFGWKIGGGDPTSGFDYGLVEPGYGGLPGGIGSTANADCGHATFHVEVDDPTAMLIRAEQLGGKTVKQEAQVLGLNLRRAYFADPEGHIVGLSKNAAVGGRGDAGANPVLCFEVMGRDPKALRQFYTDLFGWTMSEAAAFGYWLVEAVADGVPGGIGPARAAGQNGGSGFATFKVEVEDLKAVLAKAAAFGGRTMVPVTQVPGTRIEIAYCTDPDGHVIGLTRGMGYR